MAISKAIRRLVQERAADRCEYCGLLQIEFPYARFHIDHVIPRQHGGNSDKSNLCLACHWCNFFKGPNLASQDEQGQVVPLFNPRTQQWIEHFIRQGDLIEGRTATGRATARILNFNDPDRIELRRSISKRG